MSIIFFLERAGELRIIIIKRLLVVMEDSVTIKQFIVPLHNDNSSKMLADIILYFLHYITIFTSLHSLEQFPILLVAFDGQRDQLSGA
jgi:hypothetical protein